MAGLPTAGRYLSASSKKNTAWSEADGLLVLDREAVIEAADELGLFIVGVARDGR